MLRKQIKLVFLLITSLIGGALFAQVTAGDKFFERGDYLNAIVKYKRVSKSNSPKKQEAFVKLANAYKLTNDYPNAELAYANALAIDTVSLAPEVYYNYAQVLKANNKYEEAAEQYYHYIRLSPNDENAKSALKFCREIKYYLSMPIEYSVTPVANINTERSEFSPFINNGKLIFVAEREEFDIVNYSQQETNGQPYLNMFVSNLKGQDLKKSKTFSKTLNSDFHDGPACINYEGNTIYFTRSTYKEKKGFVNNSKLYTAEGSGNSWKKIKPIDELNNDDYSVAHPSISSDNMTLFFSSNMPGGRGGKDIWMSYRDTINKKWEIPVNLGPDINTSGDEMFPSIRKDGTLFFSSNGLPGYGGLDIYSAKQAEDGKWLLNRNEGLDVNSSKDDFGITFLNDSIGYFSSDRVGGKGRDDIYHYYFKSKMMAVEGTILLTENARDYAKKKKVFLMNDNGTVLDSMYTNNKGFFSFKNLPMDKKYMTAIDGTDPEFEGKARFYLAEKDSSVIHRVTNHFGKNKFVFKNLPLEANALPDLSTNDELVLAGNLLYGIDQKPLKNTILRLVSDKGDVLEETTTNEFGSFAFRNIPADQNYLISLEDTDIQLPEGTKMVLTNKTGKELKTFIKGGSKFSFRLLGSDKNTIEAMDADDESLVMDIFGYMYDQNRHPLVNTKIKVHDENGGSAQEFITNDKGRFKFKNLDANKNYIFEAEEDEPSLKGITRIYIADAKGKIYKIVDLAEGKFKFQILEVDKLTLGEFVVDDPWMHVAKIKEKEKPKERVDIFGFLFDENKNPVPYVKLSVHDVNGGDMQKLSSNDKGIFNFKKIATEKDYILETEANDPALKGIKRLYIADGKGDIYKVLELTSGKFSFKMLDADKIALGEYIVDDPWMKVAVMKEKAKEVADIMGYVYDQDKRPLVNTKIKVHSADGTEEQQLSTNEQGRFNFKKLSPDKDYIFETDENDPNLKNVKKIYIADAQGEVYKILDLSEGKFSFKILDLDKVALADMATNDDLWMKVAQMKVKQKMKIKEEPVVIIEEPQQPVKEEPVAQTTTQEPKKTISEPTPQDNDTTIVTIENAYFAYGKYNVSSDASEILDQVALAMELHPKLRVEISTHADARSSSAFNMQLSIKRANSVVNYLVNNKGVDKKRIKAQGYGETRILNQCVDGVQCSEEEHKINRRTEFKFTNTVKKKK